MSSSSTPSSKHLQRSEDLVALVRLGGNNGLEVADVHLEAASWVDTAPATNRLDLGEVSVSVAALCRFVGAVAAWLQTPIAELASIPLRERTSLGVGSGRLDIVLGEKNGLIATVGQVPVSVHFEVGRHSGSTRFVTDATCLGAFVQASRRCFAVIGEPV